MNDRVVKHSKVVISVMLALCISILPFNVKLSSGFHIEKQEANASVITDAASFLEEVATATTLTTAELVATIVGVTTVKTGIIITNENGVSYSNTLTQNLSGLIDTDEYPDWNTLSSSEQQDWGSEDAYSSAKFTELLRPYGLGDAYDRYHSGGGSHGFGFTSSELDILDTISSLGEDWKTGSGILLDDVINGLNLNRQSLNTWLPLEQYTYTNDANDPNWPSGFSNTVTYSEVSQAQYSIRVSGQERFRSLTFSTPIYAFSGTYNNGNSSWNMYFNKVTFKYSKNNDATFPSSSSNNATSASSNGRAVYYHSEEDGYPLVSSTVSYNGDLSALQNSNKIVYVLAQILYGESSSSYQEMSGYPSSEIENDNYDPSIVIYFPSSGIDDQTQWDDLLSYQEEITEDLSGIITLLRHIDSDLHNFDFTSSGFLKVTDPTLESGLSSISQTLTTVSSNVSSLLSDVGSILTLITHIDGDLHKFNFYSNGELKVFDAQNNIVLQQIRDLVSGFKQIFTSEGADQIIGEFDFDDIGDKVPDLQEAISDLAPFGVLALLSETIAVLSSVAQIQDPSLTFPFEFGGFSDQNWEVEIDLSFLDPMKPMINFACISFLMFGLITASLRVVELEAAA